jgi:putative Mg2+ transporter-C (MgtC) family protein
MDISIFSVSLAALMENRNLLDLTIRLTIAIVAGGAILVPSYCANGLDRYLRHKAGGLRTHMLVSLGAALFTIVPMAMSDRTDIDSLGRFIQGIVAGVGCLGAGEIIHTATIDRQDRSD